MTDVAPIPLRQHARDAVRRQIALTAIDLFEEHGFAHVTVGDIVKAAGTSARTFHRYFSSKEDTVLVDAAANGELIRRELEQCTDLEPWTALRQALQPLVDITTNDDGRALRAMRVLLSMPSLRARSTQKHQEWAEFLIPVLRSNTEADALQARALVLSALSCCDAALEEWVAEDGARPLADILDHAFTSVGYHQ
ncbi:TetR family transcriptional regulator [Streptomyces sp. NPDC101225]|uniref:acyl-CoA-like ligand-binding transcription factor n=1 Tax=Streptomyces sp. NPDC101225 TaxID=3366135 RepID=UPI00380E4348